MTAIKNLYDRGINKPGDICASCGEVLDCHEPMSLGCPQLEGNFVPTYFQSPPIHVQLVKQNTIGSFNDLKDLIFFDGRYCRIYFKMDSRSPIYGKFVKSEDHKGLTTRGLVRFVPASMEKQWDVAHNVLFTKIYDISSFHSIMLYEDR